MAERRTIGQILMGFGRITEADVGRALEYQEKNGGYFGEALLALEFVTQEELEWSLASQFDLPYVFPEADSIDPAAVELVTPEWALANLTLPIMKVGDSVTVIVDSPIKTGAVDELQRRTGLEIELALASPSKIRELVRQVYAKADAAVDHAEAHTPVDLAELVSAAAETGSSRFGISVRGHRATGWFQDRASVRRRLLSADWEDLLERDVAPPPSGVLEGRARVEWSAHLSVRGYLLPVEVQYIGGPAGAEYVFRFVEEQAALHERFPPPSQEVLSEVKLLVSSGAARFAVSTDPPEMVDELLPFLPTLLLSANWRGVHLAGSDATEVDDEIFQVVMPVDSEERAKLLEELRGFRFDAVTALLSGPLEDWLEEVLDVAGVAFVPWRPESAEEKPPSGIRWHLHVASAPGVRFEWSLQPLGG